VILLLDLDGTIADISHRLEIAGQVPDRNNKELFQRWLDTLQQPKHIQHDKPVEPIKLMVRLLKSYESNNLVAYLTGRCESLRDVTKAWLDAHNFPHGPLYMRPRGDWRRPAEFKRPIIEELVRLHGKSGIAFDDDHDGETSGVYRQNGFIHLKVFL
jgi:hypothetical protein